MSPGQLRAFSRELQKHALLERLVRLGATDIPGTPRLLMKHRGPEELAALQRGVQQGWDRRVTSPLLGHAEKLVGKLPTGRAQTVARRGARLFAQDPVGVTAAHLVPMPGAGAAYVAGKRGIERAIDRFAPLPGG